MKDLLSSILADNNYALSKSSGRFSGLVGSSKAVIVSALSLENIKILLLTNSSEEAFWYKQEISIFYPDRKIYIFQTPDAMPNETSVSPEITGQRLSVLNEIEHLKEYIVIAPIRSVLFKTNEQLNNEIIIETKKQYDMESLIRKFVEFGYKRLTVVGERGELAVKGGILDVFPSNMSEPIRIEFFGDDVVSIRAFDPVSQRSKKHLEQISILMNSEIRNKNLLQILPDDLVVLQDDQNILRLNAERFVKDAKMFSASTDEISTFEDVEIYSKKFKNYFLSSWNEPGDVQIFTVPESYVNSVEKIPSISKNYIIVSQHAARFAEYKAVVGQIRGGFENDKWVVLSDRELFGIEPMRPKTSAKKAEGVGEDIRADFAVGDYVVHEDYGVGIFRGLTAIEEGDYALIEFSENDKLYVPPGLMGKLEKYVSQEGHVPKLSRMGGTAWSSLKSKVRKSLKDLTQELLVLYSERKKAQKDPYPTDDAWQKELEDSFPYEETPDQLSAIRDIKKDLESELPMDRLLCGDVGYGKTEVALRAIVKVASFGKQTAILVPTTILAEQHYHYFKERLAAFPFKIASLSRFRDKNEQKEIVEKLKVGEVDIVVGTHRLLSKDVSFKNIGLLVIDEEHRFGVSHKEKLKKFKKNVDVLSMTATPIPRTLYFSLSGARDLSLIQTPPADRSPVKTYIAQFNPTLIKEAILRELDRGGQVFFVHNQIETIGNVAAILHKLIPELKIATAHGRMNEVELEKIMDGFMVRDFDLLLCTSIIESGLDIPNVNTIIIDRADRLGLAQLYQLRGRVGRSPVRAYAYLLYHNEDIQTETALSRLKAIQEFTSLGAGYKLALRDLEIRGSGNLLGAEQHGHMLSVGFDLYCELLEEAVNKAKGVKELTPRQVVIDLKEDAIIPENYVQDEQQRLALYRRLNILSSEKELADFKDELSDRFGKIPMQCNKLFDIVVLRIKAIKSGVKSIRGDSTIYIDWVDGRTKKFRLQTRDKIREIISRIGS